MGIRISFGFYLCFFPMSSLAEDEKVLQRGSEDKERSFGSITISEDQIKIMKGIADLLFPYQDSTENSALNTQNKNQENVIRDVIPPKSEKVLKIGIIDDNLPFAAIRHGVPVGFEVDLIRLILEEEMASIEILPIDIMKIKESIEGGKVDVVLGGLIRDCREDCALGLEYSDSYLNADIAAVVPKRVKRDLQGKSGKDLQKFSFEGKRIGVVSGSFFERYIRAARIQNAEVVVWPSHGEMLKSFLKGDKSSAQSMDILLTHHHIARDWIARNPELETLPLKIGGEVAIQMRKDSPWLAIINQRIKKLIGSQRFLDLMSRWSITTN
ncbi:MAG: transporter substrate-binding domain-containing protein [Puniceicoccales bacterium]|nr:transporter substrate-binding domain-containing protein [Puniceicoccales bacterium]